MVPFVAAVRRRHPTLPISVDTWRAGVGRAACGAGADLLNDAWQGADPGLAVVAAEHGAALVCSHAGGLPPRTDPHRVAYDDVMADVVATVTGLVDRALAAGVRVDGILVDAAHDFGKNTYHSLEVTRRLDELVATGWPVLVAVEKGVPRRGARRGQGRPAGGHPGGHRDRRLARGTVFWAHQVAATRRVLDTVGAIRGTRAPAVSRRGLS